MSDFLVKMILVLAAAGLILLLLAVAGLLARRHNKRSSVRPTGPGWTMAEIEKLHESGQLTDKQYRNLREIVTTGPAKTWSTGASENSRPII